MMCGLMRCGCDDDVSSPPSSCGVHAVITFLSRKPRPFSAFTLLLLLMKKKKIVVAFPQTVLLSFPRQ